jgi:hypothetical protein
MDVVVEPATEAAPPLHPCEELFCRAAARGDTLAAAARAAGYAPGSARRRGAELWARDEIQNRIGVLSAAHEARIEAEVEELRTLTRSLFEYSCRTDRISQAVRLLTFRYRLHRDTLAARAPTRAERERLREELRDELAPEVRSDLRLEMAASVRAELRRELHAEVVAEVAVTNGPEPSVTKRDAGRVLSRLVAEPSVTDRDIRRVPSPPAMEPSVTDRDTRRVPPPAVAAAPDHDALKAFEALLRAARARPPADRHRKNAAIRAELDEIEALLKASRRLGPKRLGGIGVRLRRSGGA